MARRAKKRWPRWVLAVILMLVGVPVSAALLLVETAWGRARLRDMAVEAIRSELGIDADMGPVRVEALPFAVTARRVVLTDPRHGRLAEAEAIAIYPSWRALLQGAVDLETITIEKPSIRLLVADGEIRNLPAVRRSTATGGALPFGEIRASDARLEVEATGLGTAHLVGIDLSVQNAGSRGVRIGVTAGHGHVEHARGREIVQRLMGDVTVGGSRLTVGHARLWTPHVKLDLRDAAAALPFGDDFEGRVEVQVALEHVRELPLAWDLPALTGLVEIEGRVTGSREGPSGEGRVTIRGVRIDQWGLGDMDLPVSFDPREVRIRGGAAHLVKDGGRVGIEARVGLGAGHPITAELGLADLQFAKLMDQLGVTPNAIVQWSVEGTFHLEGTLDPLHFGGPLALDTRDLLVTGGAYHDPASERIVGTTRGLIRGRVAVRPNALRFEDLVAETEHSTLRGDVHLGFDNVLRVDVTSHNLDLVDATPLVTFPIAGHGLASVSVSGTMSEPVVTGRLDFDGFSFDTFPFGDVESDMRLEKDSMAVRFPVVTASKNESRYRVEDLLLDFTDDRLRITGTMRAQRFTLADFYDVFHYETDERFQAYQALTHGTVGVTYTRGFPGDSPAGTLIADLDLAIPSATFNDFAFTDGELRARWHWANYEQGYRGGKLTIEHLHLRKGPGTIAVSGAMELGGALELRAVGEALRVADTEGLANRFPELGGTYGMTAEIEGSLEVPRAHLDVGVTGLTWKGRMLGDGRAYVRLTDRWDPWIREAEEWGADPPRGAECARARAGLWRADWPADPPVRTRDGLVPALEGPMAFLVCGEALDGGVRVDVAIGRTKAFPVRGRVEARGIGIDAFLPPLDARTRLTGRFSGLLDLYGGALLEDDSLVGDLELEELRVGQDRVEIRNRGRVRVTFDRGAFEIGGASFRGPASELTVRGSGRRRGGLAVTIDGNVDLGLLATVSPRITQASGRVDLRVKLSGAIEDPGVYGEAQVRGGSFHFAGFPVPVEDLHGRVTFSERRVLLEEFEATVAGGTLALAGDATLRDRGIEQYRVEALGAGLNLSPEDGVRVVLGGNAALEWARGRRLPLLRGLVRIDRLTYERPVQLLPTIAELSREERVEVDRYDPAEDNVELDVQVQNDQPMRVANALLEASVRVDETERPFRIVGTDQRYGVLGTLALPRGVVSFRNREFEIRRGTIQFDDAYRVDPHFDVLATTTIRRSGDLAGTAWDVHLHAHGGRGAFRLDMSSDPELSQEDLSLLLTLGMTRSEFDQLQQGDVSSTVALEALATVTGVDREVRRAVPVDDFRVTSAYSPATNRTEPQISIGKRVARDLRVSASRSLGEAGEFRTSVEWQLGDQTSLEAVYDNVNTTTASPVGNLGVDLRWRLEFE